MTDIKVQYVTVSASSCVNFNGTSSFIILNTIANNTTPTATLWYLHRDNMHSGSSTCMSAVLWHNDMWLELIECLKHLIYT